MAYIYRKATQEDEDKYNFLLDMSNYGLSIVKELNFDLNKLHKRICIDSEVGGILSILWWGRDDAYERTDIAFMFKLNSISYRIDMYRSFPKVPKGETKIAIYKEDSHNQILQSFPPEVLQSFYEALTAYQNYLSDRTGENYKVILNSYSGERIL